MTVLNYGNPNARIFLVGEAPGADEEIEGKPFVGKAGQHLRSSLLAKGIQPEDCYFGNISNERPPDNKIAAFFDRHGFPNEIVLAGIDRLREDIERVNPHVVVALGNYPLWALTGKGRWTKDEDSPTGHGYRGISSWRGSVIPGNPGIRQRKVAASYHPSLLLRSPSDQIFFEHDLARVRSESAYPDIRRRPREFFIHPTGHERLEIRRRLLEEGPFITLDIEYIGSRWLRTALTTSRDWVAVFRMDTLQDILFVQEIVTSGRPLCGQNAMTDLSIMEWYYNIKAMQFLAHDTMLMSHAAYIELPKDLGTICSWKTDIPCYWFHIDKPFWTRVGANDKKAHEELDEYNGYDGLVTHEAAEDFLANELQRPDVRAAYDFEMALHLPLWIASKRGCRIDKDRMFALNAKLDKELAEMNQRLEDIIGISINVRSTPQCSKLLFDILKFKPKRSTKTGNSTDDYVLAQLSLEAETPAQKTILELIRGIRKRENLKSKFTEVEFDNDGRLRFHFNIGGTVTYRLSSKKFYPTGKGVQGQNIPRPKEIRSVVIPDDGRLFFYADLERAESLVVAHLTGDPVMLKHHQPGINAHKELAHLLFGLDVEQVDKDGPEYYLSKQTRHAGNYMEGWMTFMKSVNKVANVTGISIDAPLSKKLIYGYRDLHPFLQQWWDSVQAALKENNGRLWNLLGWPRTFYDRRDLPAAIAFIPQSTVGGILNVGFSRLANHAEFKALGGELLLQVHDAIGGQFWIRNLDRCVEIIRECMTVEVKNPRTRQLFTIPVEINVGPSWGECKEYKKAA